MPDSHFKPWTADEVIELKRLTAEGAPITKIAQALGRSPEAVLSRLRSPKTDPRPISLKPV